MYVCAHVICISLNYGVAMVLLCRGHVEDVYDMCWSSDSRHLISGSVDNTAIVWNTQTGGCGYTTDQYALLCLLAKQ